MGFRLTLFCVAFDVGGIVGPGPGGAPGKGDVIEVVDSWALCAGAIVFAPFVWVYGVGTT